MCAVPLILDRIYKNILDSVDKRGSAFGKAFERCYAYKRHWMERGWETPLSDRMVFDKIRGAIQYTLKMSQELSCVRDAFLII